MLLGACVGVLASLKYGIPWSLAGGALGGVLGYLIGPVLGLAALLVAHVHCRLRGEVKAERRPDDAGNAGEGAPGTLRESNGSS